MNIEYVGRDAIVDTGDVSFTYQVLDNPRAVYQSRAIDTLDWNDQSNFIGDYLVHRYGHNDDLPDVIKLAVQTNHNAPGTLKKKTQLIWGQGPILYKEKLIETETGNKRIRILQEDAEIEDWLESWDYQSYLIKAITDYQHIEGVFSKFELSKGARIGSPFIAKIVHQYCDRTRLATARTNLDAAATHVITTAKSFTNVRYLSDYKVYPLFDFLQPFAYANAVLYSNMYSFCTDYYTVPDIYGSLEWLKRSTAVPLIFKALSKNSINLKYHIVSPQAFWDKKEQKIKENCTQRGEMYKDSMLAEYTNQFLEKISQVLASDENTGKFLHTTKTIVDGVHLQEHGWEIKVIDQNIKDFVDAQIAISNHANHALSSGLNLHSALANVSESGKADSGSEQIYAFKTFLKTGVDIPEMIIMKAINYALKANWPDKKLKLGFLQESAEKEQDIAPKNRLINQ